MDEETKRSLSALHELAHALLAEQYANRRIIGALLATHPRPDQLLATWHEASPDAVDQEMERLTFENVTFRRVFLARMAAVTQQVERLSRS